MAYAYSQIEEMMGNQQNQNIFADQGQNMQPGQNQDVVSSNQSVKTNTEGDINANAPVSNSTAPKVTTSSSEQNRQNTQKAYQQNIGKTQKPAAIQSVKQGLDSAKEGLQKRAQDYAAAQQTKQNYTVDEGTLGSAIEGDSAASAKTSDLLNRSTYNPVDSFDYGDLSVKDANLFDSNAGIKELVSRGRRPTYTPQMAAFDTMLLQMDPNFRSDVQGIKKQANELQSAADKTKADAEKAANEAAKANLERSQTMARDFLGSRANAIQAENAAEAAARNEALKNIDVKKIGEDEARAAREKAMAQLDQLFGAGRAANQLGAVNVDPSQFVTRAADATADQFWSADDARRFNQINALLGKGGQSAVESAALAPDYTVNQGGLLDAFINPAIQARQEADVAGAKQIQDLLAGFQKRADDDDYRRAGLASNYRSDLNQMAREAGAMSNFNDYRDILGDDEAMKQVIGSYMKENPALNTLDLSASDVMTQAEADQLNAIAQDIGSVDRYGAGGYQQGGPTSFINPANFQENLLKALQSYRATPEGQSSLNRSMGPKETGIVGARPGQLPIGQQDGPEMRNPQAFTFVGNKPVWDSSGDLNSPEEILRRISGG